MNISLSPKTQRLLKQRMKTEGYSSPEEAVHAGLLALQQLNDPGSFAPGELDELLRVADAQIERGEIVDGEQAMSERKRRRSERTKKAG